MTRTYNRRKQRLAQERKARFNAAFVKATLTFCVFATGWALNDITYIDSDGFGFITNFGGYHFSTLGESF